MSGKIEIELDSSGIVEFMQSVEVQNILTENAQALMANIGDSGYEFSDPIVGKSRARVNFGTNSRDSYIDNLENNTLLKVASGMFSLTERGKR